MIGCAAPGAGSSPRALWPAGDPSITGSLGDSAPSTHPAGAAPADEGVDAEATHEAPSDGPTTPVLDLPERPSGAETGSEFLARTEGLGRSAMDEAISEAILAGNVPSYQRRFVPITVEAEGRVATLHVLCDYLAVGSDEDFVRMPMTSAAAQRIANRVGATLPTPKLVDEIYRQAVVKLPPSWIDGGPTEGTLADYKTHHDTLEERRLRGGHPLGVLTAGHKKDIVLCELVAERPGRVAIYGWHKREGSVVQPLSTAHSCRYADYSHGVRLVDQQMRVGSEIVRVSDALADAELAYLLSDDGPLSVMSYPTELPPYEGPKKKRARR